MPYICSARHIRKCTINKHSTHLVAYFLRALSIGHKMNSFRNLPNGVSKVLAFFCGLHRNEV